jgi:hypothetical protein
VKTGAEEVARGYFEALVRKDWASAYGALDPDSRGRYDKDQFAQLAEQYRSSFGFEPREANLWSCDEHDDQATAHVTFKGRAGSSLKFRRDAVSLRRRGTAWAVVLPANFGKVKPRKS